MEENNPEKLKSVHVDDQHLQPFKPRKYQVEVFEVALKRNTIVVLNTGAGKTMIAVMLINEIAKSLSNEFSDQKKIIVFLAPTVHLVRQQCQVIKGHSQLQVGEYYGALGVDDWSMETWKKDIEKNDVFVMTPQILLDALRKAYLSLQEISLLVIDECHRAVGNHPYAKIMEEFYHKSMKKPRVFGTTASPVIKKGVSSDRDCEKQFSELELLMDSHIYPIKNGMEIEEVVPSAKEKCIFYSPPLSSNVQLEPKLESCWSKFDAELLALQRSHLSRYPDIDQKYELLRKRLSNSRAKILCCVEDLGLICGYEAVKICMEKVPKFDGACEFLKKSSLLYKSFFEEVSSEIQKSLSLDSIDWSEIVNESTEYVRMGYISAKLHELLQVFKTFGVSEQVCCLIFVEKIMTAKVIQRITKNISQLAHFKISYLTGSCSSRDGLAKKVQKETLESFHSGKVNLLFTTDVIEEGIDVPSCSTVIRFDLPKTVRSYIQSRGRARQSNSQFLMMLERGNKNQRDKIFDIIRSEFSMANVTVNREPVASSMKPCSEKATYTYTVEVTGATVSADSSINLINKYCSKLPKDEFCFPQPKFRYMLEGNSYRCKLCLPPNAAFETITGPEAANSNLAKQLVCLEACKKLHKLNALDDHLLPSTKGVPKNNSLADHKSPSSGVKAGASGAKAGASGVKAGSTKRKELHGLATVNLLSGSWGDKLDGTPMYAYKIEFSSSISEERYSSFVLLLEEKLDDDVGNIEIELFLVSKFVNSHLSYCGQIFLDAEQVSKAKQFHELFFNGLFGKLFLKVAGERQFLLKTDESLWDQSNMYLLLPLDTSKRQRDGSWKINWMAIESCFSTVNFFKENAWLNAKQSESSRVDMLLSRAVQEDYMNTKVVHLANTSLHIGELKGMVVMGIHTGRIYSVLDVIDDATAESPFHGNINSGPSGYSSYADYFKKKYGIVLLLPSQPLLLLKQPHNAFNLLVDFKKEGVATTKRSQDDPKSSGGNQSNHVHMPPELLVKVDVRREVLRSFYLLPSLMHRMESLMLASQLRKKISCHSSDPQIPIALILEALTTLRCNESFSMERLELLGDSILKYTIGCYLFLKYPKFHEGQLSSRRSIAVCNSTLHTLGTDHKVQGYIRDSPFDPRRWTAPGQRPIRLSPCDHGVDTLEVPLDIKKFTDDPKIVIGKCCDRGHRWLGSKTISDCVEALIGAYYVGGGLVAALRLMKWFGMEVEVKPCLVEEAIKSASLHSWTPKATDIETLESKIGYRFTVKGLLLEAITHATKNEKDGGFCYQRLEFLGDAVLDILITWYLYQNHVDVDPGELTDLRSASVNNDNFALAAVKHDLYPHLQHCSGALESQIHSFVEAISDADGNIKPLRGAKSPKVLGDLVESIVGAILIDTKLNLEEIWKIIKPILSPIVTPDMLELAPLRELIELCDSLGYFIEEKCTTDGEMVRAELKLQLKDAFLVTEGIGQTRKVAKGQAALHLLKQLEDRGISFSKKRKFEMDPTSPLSKDAQVDSNKNDNNAGSRKKQKLSNLQKDRTEPMAIDATSKASCSGIRDIPELPPINMKKGGPRTTMYDVCKRMQWRMPSFQTMEEKSRTPIEFVDGSEKKTGFSSFVSVITLIIPEGGTMEVGGDKRADKKSSFDSAAINMLRELERQGKIIFKS